MTYYRTISLLYFGLISAFNQKTILDQTILVTSVGVGVGVPTTLMPSGAAALMPSGAAGVAVLLGSGLVFSKGTVIPNKA